MNVAPEKDLATQALAALHLRRQWERGQLTQEEYRTRLASLQAITAPPDPPSSRDVPAGQTHTEPAPTPTPTAQPLMSAMDVLHLRRRLDRGDVSPEEYQAQLHESLENLHAPEQQTSPRPTVRLKPPAPEVLLSPKTVTTRVLAMKCPRCTIDLSIDDVTAALQCPACAAAITVERGYCTISLHLKPDAGKVTTDPFVNIAAELAKLKAEAAMLMRVKRVSGAVGLLCVGVFAYLGIADLTAQRTAMGTTVIVCGSALLSIAVIIARHTSKVRTQLSSRIRALQTEE